MFSRFFTAKKQKLRAHQLYQRLVEQARNPVFYAEPVIVPDTMEGRFELILLHLFLIENCLSEQDGQERLRRILQETLISDMDRTLRELGVGDMSLGKEMKKVGAALLGRLQAYRDAVAADKPGADLAEIFERNITENKEAIRVLTDYTIRSHALLRSQTDIVNMQSMLKFPEILVTEKVRGD